MATPPSKKYPGKVFFFAAEPQKLIDAGYDSLRVEKRKSPFDPWVAQTKADKVPDLILSGKRYNYFYIDEESEEKAEFRAILQNSVTPGAPVDIVQPTQRAVDTAYEQIMTIRELKEIYLWGEDSAFVADNGDSQPDYTYAHSIRFGIKKVETKLGIICLPRPFTDKHDWMRENGRARGEYLAFDLDQFPVIGRPVVKTNFPGSPQEAFPDSWIRLTEETGSLMIVPDNSRGPTAPISGRHFIPDAYLIDYFAGFSPGDFPPDLKEIIGMEASFEPLNVGGDLVGGAGLAGSSLSLDGLSQSITTTNSSTNAGFGARLIQYEKQLKEFYKTAVPYYRGLRMHVA